jgi:hypothetical protein
MEYDVSRIEMVVVESVTFRSCTESDVSILGIDFDFKILEGLFASRAFRSDTDCSF